MHPPPIMGLFMADGNVSPLAIGFTLHWFSTDLFLSPSQFCSVVASVDREEGTIIKMTTTDMVSLSEGAIASVLNSIFQIVSMEL